MTLGALTLVAAGGARTFGPEDLRLAELLAKRAAVAVDNARLYGEERRLARQRDMIARASEILGRSLEPDALMGGFAELLVDEIAEEATIRLSDGRTIVRGRGTIGTTAPALSRTLRHREVELGTVTVRGTWPFDEDVASLLTELTSRATVALENAQLYEREHRVAVTLQRAMLPAELPNVAGLAFDAVYHPGAREAEIGGDWYDAIALPDGRVVLSIGDVTGRGLTAAVIMGRVRMAIETVAIYEPDPARLLDAADAVLRRAHPDAIVTALVGVLDPHAQRFTYATAGHPAPLVRARDGTTRQLPGRGLPLGLRDGKASPPVTIVLPPGALIALYTDGLVESTRDIAEGERRLFAALRDPEVAQSPAPAAAIVGRVLNGGSHDDVAVLTVRCDGAPLEGEPWALRWRFDPREYRHARGVRETVIEALVLHGEGVDLPAAELVFGELVGNAARHAPGTVDVELTWDDPSTPVLHVADEGPGYAAQTTLPALDAESGRGLYLVAHLTRAFSVTTLPQRGARARAVLLAR
jgi:GAF domain-containing protein